MAPGQPERLHDVGRRRAWFIWGVALAVYVLAVFNRSSLGVAGLLAADRFDIKATQLPSFTTLQLLVYAGMQVPVGVFLDRFGSRAMLLTGSLAMAAGQLAFAFAFAHSYPEALLARAVIEPGDAMVFISVMRLVAVWFLVRQAPVVTQLTGQLGQPGSACWPPHPCPSRCTSWGGRGPSQPSPSSASRCSSRWRSPSRTRRTATRAVQIKLAASPVPCGWCGATPAPGSVSGPTSPRSPSHRLHAAVGLPFLLSGEGLSPTTAGVLLMLMTGWALVSGLSLGRAVARFPYFRSYVVLGVVTSIVTVWTVVLLWPGPAPLWLLVTLVCVVAVGGPTSMVGFDLARSFIPVEALGRANGVVNIGDFVPSLLSMALIGMVLDLRQAGSGDSYGLDDFRVALSV